MKRSIAMNTQSILKHIAVAIGASVVLAAGVAQASEKEDSAKVTAATQVKPAPAVGTNSLATPVVSKDQAREPVDTASPAYRKFLDEIAARSGG
jgi:hypothetical protein